VEPHGVCTEWPQLVGPGAAWHRESKLSLHVLKKCPCKVLLGWRSSPPAASDLGWAATEAMRASGGVSRGEQLLEQTESHASAPAKLWWETLFLALQASKDA